MLSTLVTARQERLTWNAAICLALLDTWVRLVAVGLLEDNDLPLRIIGLVFQIVLATLPRRRFCTSFSQAAPYPWRIRLG